MHIQNTNKPLILYKTQSGGTQVYRRIGDCKSSNSLKHYYKLSKEQEMQKALFGAMPIVKLTYQLVATELECFSSVVIPSEKLNLT